jgi:hypothetical protein
MAKRFDQLTPEGQREWMERNNVLIEQFFDRPLGLDKAARDDARAISGVGSIGGWFNGEDHGLEWVSPGHVGLTNEEAAKAWVRGRRAEWAKADAAKKA